MYGFQNEDFLKTLNGAVAQIGEINRIADKVSDLGYKNIYLVGTGGTYAIISLAPRAKNCICSSSTRLSLQAAFSPT